MVDTVVRLFESTATEFNNGDAALLGLGVLPDVLSAEVVEERNGEFELQMTHSVDGRRYNDLALRRLLVCKPNPFATPQAFRIYEISKPINGVVTVMAEHISYDLSGYVCGRFAVEATNVNEAFTAIEANSTPTCPFDFWSDNEVSSSLFVATPMTIRSILGGNEGSILDVFSPGEYEFDNFHVKFHSARGMDRGVTIRYGKNLTDLEQEENCSNVYTAVYPYWFSEDVGLLVLTEKIVPVPGTFDFTRIMPLDLTSEFDEKPNEAALRTAAQKYITDNKIGIPKVSLTVSFVQLAQSEEYKNYALLEEVHLCDTVTVEFPKLGVSSTAKCIKTRYNVLTGKYISIELGETKSNLSSTIAQQSETISEISPESSVFQNAMTHAAKLITGGLGGYVILRSSSGGSQPDELLAMDADNVDNAHNVWRFNAGGLAHSPNGYDNTLFDLALTMDGQIVADKITSGHMSADMIRGGTLSMGGTTAAGSYGDGVIRVYDSNNYLCYLLNKDGFSNYSNRYSDYETRNYFHDSYIIGYHRSNNSSTWTQLGYLDLCRRFTIGQRQVNGVHLHTGNFPIYIDSSGDEVIVEGHPLRLQGSRIFVEDQQVVGSLPYSSSLDTAIEYICFSPGSSAGSVYIPDSIGFGLYNGSVYWVDVDSSSDEKLKKNIKTSKINALDALSKVEYYEFDFIENDIHKDIGYMAQQLEKAIPSAVFDAPDHVNKDKKATSTSKKINSDELVIYATKAIKELNEKIVNLEQRILDLEKRGIK